MQIPFNRASLTGHEIEYLLQAVHSGHISGDGAFSRRCQTMLEELLGVPQALLTTSCTHALEMAALLLDLQPGDEVIVPSFTFVSTANAFALRGARPVFLDIRPDTLNLDERLLEAAITPHTRAVAPVHYAGISCEMDAILTIAEQHELAVIEDNAHGLFGAYRDKPLGTIGCLATQSFHETKNITCGEGGALLINDVRLIERAEILREKGTDRNRFFRGQVDKYTWVDLGSSFLPSDILAAFLLSQLEAREVIQAKRRRIWETYHTQLQAWAAAQGVQTPTVPSHCTQAYHLYYVVMPSPEDCQGLIAHLKSREILAVFHYVPLHTSAMGQRFGGFAGQCPVTESVSARLVRLPFFTEMTENEQARCIEAVSTYICRTGISAIGKD